MSTRLVVKGLPAKVDEQHLLQVFSKFGTVTDVSLKKNEEGKSRRFAFIGFEDEKSCQEAEKKLHNQYIRTSKVVIERCKPLTITPETQLRRGEQKGKGASKRSKRGDKGEDAAPTKKEEETEEDGTSNEDVIMETGRLFLRNLPYICTDAQLLELFKPFGEVADLQCIIDKESGKCKGFAMVTFMFPEHALKAYKELDGSIFKGRMLHIMAGKEKPAPRHEQNQRALSKYQLEKANLLKSEAAGFGGGNGPKWNPLFMGANATAETFAGRMEVDKFDLVAGDGQNSAGVRMAMAETRLINETRDFMDKNQVQLEAPSSSKGLRRSETTILVKNLPSSRHKKLSNELKVMFARFGPVKGVVMQENGVTALVEMENKVDSKAAFKGLSYNTSLGGQPLYLEWAPQKLKGVKEEVKEESMQQESEDKQKEDDAEQKNQRTKLLVRNIPFQASKKELTQLFSAFGELKILRLPKKAGSIQHRGFCFVDYVSTGDAKRALNALVHSTHLYGRRLVLEWAKVDEETVDELQAKSAGKLSESRKDRKRKTKKEIRDAINEASDDD